MEKWPDGKEVGLSGHELPPAIPLAGFSAGFDDPADGAASWPLSWDAR